MTRPLKILVFSTFSIIIFSIICFAILRYRDSDQPNDDQEKNLNSEPEDDSGPDSQSSDLSDTSDWETYRNEKSRFEIHHPKHWSVHEFIEGNILDSPRITLESKNGSLISLYPKGGYDRGVPSMVSEEYITVNGQTAIKRDFGLRSDGKRMLIIYNIGNWWPDNRISFLSSTSTERRVYELEEFKTILSTFRILE